MWADPQLLPRRLDSLAHGLNKFRFSRKVDELPWMFEILKQGGVPRAARVNTLYKRKADKVRSVNTDESDGTAPGGSKTWREDMLRKERRTESPDKEDLYAEWLIPKFSEIPKGSRLTPERIEKLIMGSITAQEKDLLIAMLFNREAALAWEFAEMGKVKPEVSPPVQIRTVPHKPWQSPGFPVPRALNQTVIEMLKDRVAKGILEPCHGPYRNPWFLVKKKDGKYRLVNHAVEVNRHTIRDANLPPVVDTFSEEFAGCAVASLIDLFSGYDQIELDSKSRDMTVFITPLRLFRQTTLPQGATNSIAQFVRIVTKILEKHIPHICLPFMDDVGIKGPKTIYDGEEVVPGIRRYMLK